MVCTAVLRKNRPVFKFIKSKRVHEFANNVHEFEKVNDLGKIMDFGFFFVNLDKVQRF